MRELNVKANCIDWVFTDLYGCRYYQYQWKPGACILISHCKVPAIQESLCRQVMLEIASCEFCAGQKRVLLYRSPAPR